MSFPDDDLPPPERETLDELPAAATEVAIPRGKAQIAVALAFATVTRAIGELETAALALEGVATACARALDAGATEQR